MYLFTPTRALGDAIRRDDQFAYKSALQRIIDDRTAAPEDVATARHALNTFPLMGRPAKTATPEVRALAGITP